MTTPGLPGACDNHVNDGVPSSSWPDHLNGGTPSSDFEDHINGGAAAGLCPPLSTGLAGYLGTLGDGGTGHSVLIRDRRGTPVLELPCRDVEQILWSRELTEVSRAVISAGSFAAPEVLSKLRYWIHEVDVFRDGDPVWTGVIQIVDGDAEQATITARDYGCYLWRTRTQTTKSWADTDPVTIAGELFASMYQWHVLPGADPALFASSVAYDYSSGKDRRRADQAMADLVKLGVDWTIYRGRAVVMPTIRSAALVAPVGFADCDFAERMKIRRDGTRFFNDVLVKGKNFSATATREIAGLRLQDIVALDDLFGANNVRLAAEQLVARRAASQVQVIVPAGATIRPDAPVPINMLMPGVIFPCHTDLAGGVETERRLEKVEVVQDASGETVSVTLGHVPGQASDDSLEVDI